MKFVGKISKTGNSLIIIVPRKNALKNNLLFDDWVTVRLTKKKKFEVKCNNCGKTVTGGRVYKPKKCPHCKADEYWKKRKE